MATSPKDSVKRRAIPTDADRMEQLSLKDVCRVLGIGASTFYEWRAKGRAPEGFKLPNGQLRFYKSVFFQWLDGLEG